MQQRLTILSESWQIQKLANHFSQVPVMLEVENEMSKSCSVLWRFILK